jgi:hypothetical protein
LPHRGAKKNDPKSVLFLLLVCGGGRMASKSGLTAYYFTLEKHLEPELDVFARRCAPKSCFVYKDEPSSVTIGFSEPDDAMLFMNLYDGEIRDEYKVVSDDAGIGSGVPA